MVTANSTPEPNVDKNGVGIQGYDPVAFFTDGKPVLGKEEFHVTYAITRETFAARQTNKNTFTIGFIVRSSVVKGSPRLLEANLGGIIPDNFSRWRTRSHRRLPMGVRFRRGINLRLAPHTSK